MKRFVFLAAAIAALVVMVPEPALRAQTQYWYGTTTIPWSCRVTAVTVATQCQAAPAAGLRAYISDITYSNNTAGANSIKAIVGTGTNCGTGTADLTAPVAFGAVIANWDHSYSTPLQPPAASAICISPSAAISISATLSGFLAP